MKTCTVKYFGNDEDFWERIQIKFKEYPDVFPVFLQEGVGEGFSAPGAFSRVYSRECDIVYVDLSERPEAGLSLCKLLCRNNETRVKSVAALSSEKQGREGLLKGVLAGVRLNFIKSIEMDDVVYHPLSLLDFTVAPASKFAEGKSVKDFRFEQLVRIGYIADDHFRVETNSPLKEGSVVRLKEHPLERVMESSRFYVQNPSETDLYYNQRYSYNLKYTYLENDFFKASEKAWIEFKALKKSAESLDPSDENRLIYLSEDVERRRNELFPAREKVKEWVANHGMEQAPKRLKVLVVDQSLSIFKEYYRNVEKFGYSINFQTALTGDFYQISRFRPHLLILRTQEEDINAKVLSPIISKIKRSGEGYEPAILVFNCSVQSESLKRREGYEHILAYKNEADLDIVKKMSDLLDDRFHITDPQGKVFLKTSDPRSVAKVEREGTILKFNESELFFETDYHIPMWTTFVMVKPMDALFTVLPHGSREREDDGKSVYRALINGVGELEKRQLRRLVNLSLQVKNKSES